jgi:hypothetical protein
MPSLLVPLVAFCCGRSFMDVVLTLEQHSVKLICFAHGVRREYHICTSSLIEPCREETRSLLRATVILGEYFQASPYCVLNLLVVTVFPSNQGQAHIAGS